MLWSAATTFLKFFPNDVLLWKDTVDGRDAAVLKLHELAAKRGDLQPCGWLTTIGSGEGAERDD